MAEYLIQDTTLTAIADAIRAKTGGTERIPPENMPAVIEGIESGGSAVNVKCAYACITSEPAYSSSGTQSLKPSVNVPSSATILSVLSGIQVVQGSTGSLTSNAVVSVSETTSYSRTSSVDSMSVSTTTSFVKTARKYCRASAVIIVIYTV